MQIKGLNFIQTCSICPEQYDVKDSSGKQVGYVRLRFGRLTCDYPDVGGETIYVHDFDDEWLGCFDDTYTRIYYLNIIASKINKKINNDTKRNYFKNIINKIFNKNKS